MNSNVKFRDPKTWEVLEAIGAARARACRGHACDDCHLGQFNQGELYGDTCDKFVKEYPAEAARLMGFEVVEEKEELMEKTDKPRICQVLGVDVGEKATYTDPRHGEIEFEIEPDGNTSFIFKNGMQAGQIGIGYAILQLINHPDRIIRKPRFTEEEVAVLKALQKAGIAEIERGTVYDTLKAKSRTVNDGKSSHYEQWFLPKGLLPSLHPGQGVSLQEIIKEAGKEQRK